MKEGQRGKGGRKNRSSKAAWKFASRDGSEFGKLFEAGRGWWRGKGRRTQKSVALSLIWLRTN